jgi:hypothetical protein
MGNGAGWLDLCANSERIRRVGLPGGALLQETRLGRKMADMRTQPETPFKAASSLSAEERRKREDAVRFANASIALEGFKVSASEQARSDRFIAGEIDLAEFLKGE